MATQTSIFSKQTNKETKKPNNSNTEYALVLKQDVHLTSYVNLYNKQKSWHFSQLSHYQIYGNCLLDYLVFTSHTLLYKTLGLPFTVFTLFDEQLCQQPPRPPKVQ